MSANPRNVYILGTAYCGSTLLGNALNAHSAIKFAGEISRLPAFGVGSEWTTCPVCYSRSEGCSVWSPSFIERVSQGGAGTALDLFREATRTPIAIDGSKHVAWLRRVHAEKALAPDTFVLIAVRSPFSFATSTKRRDGFEPWLAANVWRDTIFDVLRCVSDLGLPHGVVRYEEFASDPETVLKRVSSWLNIDFDPSMLRFWETPVHALGGNAGAYVWYPDFRKAGEYASETDEAIAKVYQQRPFGGWSDDKWRQALTPTDISLILGTPSLVDMCSLVGYNLGEWLMPSQATEQPQQTPGLSAAAR